MEKLKPGTYMQSGIVYILKNKHIYACFLFLFISLIGAAQDIIIRQDSTKIFCKITGEDSLHIFYRNNKDKKRIETSIVKSEILSHSYGGPIPAEVPEEPDKPKIVSRYADYTAVKGDSIYMNENRQFEFKGSVIGVYEVADIMKHDTLAHKEIMKAAALHNTGIGIAVIGSSIIQGVSTATGSMVVPALLIDAAVLTATMASLIPLKVCWRKHLKIAIKLFNDTHRL